jgi:hypothetical protein
MNNGTDMRIPLFFSGTADTYLVEAPRTPPPGAYAAHFTLPKPGHLIGCPCCPPRGPVSAALAALFRARATGAAPFFKSVVVLASPEGEAAVRAAVAGDVLTGARYKV